jgi:hypothetical protein
VAHRDVAAVADAAAHVDQPEGEVEFLPGEEQRFVVAAGGLEIGAAQRMAGADEGRGVEFLGRARQQA